tara:strand:- start:250 stop:495 length:246 start_codon:yes stop_codon:yes gene_type:complete
MKLQKIKCSKENLSFLDNTQMNIILNSFCEYIYINNINDLIIKEFKDLNNSDHSRFVVNIGKNLFSSDNLESIKSKITHLK